MDTPKRVGLGGIVVNIYVICRVLGRSTDDAKFALMSTNRSAMSSLLLDAIEKSGTSLVPAFIAINVANHI